MRLAIVSPYSWAHPGGVNNHVAGLASEMSRRGHEVAVVAPDEGPRVEGARFVSAGRSIPFPANGSIARIAVLPGTPRAVKNVVSAPDLDVVHVHEPLVPLASTTAVLSAHSRCRVVGTFHAAGDGRSLAYGAARMTLRGVHRRLDVSIAVSRSARDLAAKYFPSDYQVIPNGVDPGRFRPGSRPPEWFPHGEGPVVLFVGRKEKRKGLEVLLRAFDTVASQVPGSVLVVAGGGYESGAGRPLPASIEGRVLFRGFVTDQELPAVYAAADVFCAPALGGESFGIVLIEAMACGTPVLASDIPGYRDVVEDTGGGELFRAGDTGDLARVLTRMLRGESMRRELSDRGTAAVPGYSWASLGDHIEAVYQG